MIDQGSVWAQRLESRIMRALEDTARDRFMRQRTLGFIGLIALTLLASSSALASVRIASWNVKHLGWQNDKNLEAVAQVIERFDLVAIQEVMKPAAAKQLAAVVSGTSGNDWGVTVSNPIGDSSYKEGYAFFWRKSVVTADGGTTLYLDPGNVFAREPLSSQFTVTVDGQPIHLTLGTVHITYGDSRSDRTDEIRYLDDYWQWLGQTFNGQRILMGDFNMPPGDRSWQAFDRMARPAITQGASTLADHGYANLYDNIWTNGDLPITAHGIADYPRWLGLDHQVADDTVSDHAPVYIVLGQATVSTRTAGSTASATESAECIDLNHASTQRLDTLAHVGPSRARAIIDGRPWRDLGDLTRVSGLSRSRVQEIISSGQVCSLADS